MPQSTNLNANPYYDDFNEDNNYYRVLFKPGVTVQTRELNNLQSILQGQIEKFGSKFFTNGGIVIPGNFGYDGAFNCVEIENSYKGVSVETYFQNFVGKTIKGRNTGILAKIEYALSSSNSEATRNTTAIYVKYQSSSAENFTTEFFEDGEELVTVEDVYVGETLFSADSAIFRTLSPSERLSTSIGSAAKIEDGVYFIRGTFVNIEKSTIILDPYTNTPSYRVGLRVVESIVDSDEDSTLVDNARGFSNYAAPGADRLKIEAFLTKKELDDYDDDEFIELFRVQNGVLNKINQNDPYAFITDVLARRTYDESGNYSVQPVNVTAIESLNDNLGNGGQYLSTQTTTSGQVPSNDLAVLKISPGKSYVKGYEVPTSTALVDYLKPRTTKLVESSSSNFRAGNLLKVNNVTGIPKIGISTDTSIFLYKTRLDTSNLPTEADKIGVCRLYDFEYDNTSYENPSSQSNVYMFDIQTYTQIQTDSAISGITTGDYIQGNYSDASGYVSTYLNDSITLYQVSGRFIKNEPLSICGIATTSTIGIVTDYSIQDIRSISDSNNTFTADSSLSNRKIIDGPFDIVVSGSTATITRQDGTSFATELNLNDIVSYSISGETLPAYAEVTSILSGNSISVTLTADVQNVCTNTLGTTGTLPSINLLRSQVKNYNDSSFYAPLEKANISEVSFLNSSIFVKKYYDGLSITGNSMTLPSLVATDFVYAPFDEERYCLVNSDTNQNIELTEENLIIGTGGKTATLTSLPVSSANAKIITTQIKSNISSKYKKLERCKSVILSRTKYNPVPAGSGLSYSRVYGTRVEDQELSLNYPDIFEVHGVFQSTTSNDPVLPSLTISGLDSADINLGEVFIGQTSGAVAICAEKLSSSSISFVYKSKNTFAIGEQIKFLETETAATITNSNPGEQNILSEFTVDNGQRKYFYDIGKLIRKNSTNQESKKIKIIFDYFKFESTDFGDIISVNSYPSNLYGEKIAVFDEIRNTDVIDVRPRVVDYSTLSTTSPFEYASRNFAAESNNPTQVLTSNESVIFDFNYYLPRTDKLTLDKNGNFGVVFGDPSDSPTAPTISEEVLDVATIRSPAYVFNTSDIEIELTNNRRYTMSDIRDIDKRVENLEFYTSLSLLEVATQNLLIEDQDGFNRFKCGFFADNFGSDEISDTTNELYSARLQNNTLSADIEETHIGIVTTTTTNTKITGKTLTLNYSEIEYQKQNFASRIVNVNPFNIVTWSGNLTLSPSADKWEEIIRRTKRKRGNRRDRTVRSSVPIKYIRSRNIGFTGTRLKPRTQYNFIFDSRNLTDGSAGSTYAFPKLVGISSVNGTFSIGETVKGYDNNGNTIKFKLCSPNHKDGPISNPTLTYSINPYNPSSPLPSLYGPESTVLNVDINSLQTSSEGDLFGNITVGMTLYGEQSKAFATVSSIKLIADENGLLIGSMFIPPASSNGIQYETGNTTARLTTTQPLLGIPGEIPSTAEANFVSEGNLVTLTRIRYYDPLAQTFNVSEEEGVFITSVDVFFQSKDAIIPVELQIREVSSGIPGGPDKIVKNLSKVLNPDQIQLSNDGTKATNFKFDNLTRLEGGREYAVVLISDSNEYNVWISRIGEVEISTASLPDVQKVIVNKQPSLGSLFKSQNGTTWVPSPEDDLKFTLKRAEFSTSGGTTILTNSILPSAAIQNKLPTNPLVALSTSSPSPYNDGRHIRIHHPNHGMYAVNNFVTISGVMPDALPVNLDATLPYTSAASITISNNLDFTSFDGSAVDPVNNPGYILINEEIIRYTGVSGNQLTGITRAQFGTTAVTHPLNSKVYKYEFNGVSLAAINTTFEGIINPTIDDYYVQISSDFEIFTADKIGGGDNVYASKNTQFSSASVNEDLIETYPSTSVLASLRTVSSTSVDGSEVSFDDAGYQEISIDSNNRFDTPRMVCSRVNELEYLPESQFNNSKSLSLQLNLKSENSKVSPVVNLDNATVVVQNYRINQPIESYTTDSRINSNTNDPNSFIHFSKRINLNTAATSLKIFLTAYRHYSSDIRVLYKLFRDDNVDEDQNWQLFPGYLNLDVNNRVIDPDNNDGSSDEFVPESLLNEYREYTFSADNLPSFTGYAIKIVGTTNNQAYSPLIKDLRAIALK